MPSNYRHIFEILGLGVVKCAGAKAFGKSTMGQSHDQKVSLDQYGLTPAELRVAMAIAAGENVKAIALRYNLSQHTVRAQLKSVFNKTGVKRQLQLALLIRGMIS